MTNKKLAEQLQSELATAKHQIRRLKAQQNNWSASVIGVILVAYALGYITAAWGA